MAYTPKSGAEILRDLVAGVVARSEVTDISEGSILAQILSTVSSELAGSEYRLARIRDSFVLSRVTGADLDQRVSELPLGGVSRLSASAARGTVMRFTRVEEEAGSGLPDEAIVPAGATLGRQDNPTVIYATTDDVVFPPSANATQSIDNISVVALVPGVVGNCAPQSINKILDMPSFINSISQTAPLVGGQEGESDEALRARAILYLSSLARCQPSALEYFALSFTASDDTRVKYAAIYEDPIRRGYSELVVDDGSVIVEGESASVRPGRAIRGVAPGDGILTIFHESPAFEPIKRIRRFDSNQNDLGVILPDKFVSLPERGIVYVDAGVFEAGDIYEIGPELGVADSGYRVFNGALIPELQRAIEGDLNDPVGNPGLRAAGTRVRVLPPEIQAVTFDMQIVPVNGVSFVDTADEVREAAVEFVLTLRPGDMLFVSQLVDRVMDNPNVLDVKFFEKSVDNPGTVRLNDILPLTNRSVLRPDPNQISVIPPEDFE